MPQVASCQQAIPATDQRSKTEIGPRCSRSCLSRFPCLRRRQRVGACRPRSGSETQCTGAKSSRSVHVSPSSCLAIRSFRPVPTVVDRVFLEVARRSHHVAKDSRRRRVRTNPGSGRNCRQYPDRPLRSCEVWGFEASVMAIQACSRSYSSARNPAISLTMTISVEKPSETSVLASKVSTAVAALHTYGSIPTIEVSQIDTTFTSP